MVGEIPLQLLADGSFLSKMCEEAVGGDVGGRRFSPSETPCGRLRGVFNLLAADKDILRMP